MNIENDGQFKEGNNLGRGRPLGSRNKTTLALEALMDGQAEALTQAVIDKALEGDTVAMRLCLERIFPVRKGRAVDVCLPEIKKSSDVMRALNIVCIAVSEGKLSPEEARLLATTLNVGMGLTEKPSSMRDIVPVLNIFGIDVD